MPSGIYLRRVKRHAVTQPQDASYRLIPLTQGQNVIVDTKDFLWLSKWNWHSVWSKDTKSFYAARSRMPRIRMHREILGCSPAEEGDHKNGDTLDNRRENLRKCTRSQNNSNKGKQKSNTTGFKGVYPVVKINKWKACIANRGRFIYLGCFATAEDAARAYDSAARKYHREFARLNFP